MDKKRIEEIRKILRESALMGLCRAAWKITNDDIRLMDEIEELCNLSQRALLDKHEEDE